MHILYLSQLVPYPADAGPKVRIYHVLQYLAAAGHQVTLVAFHRPTDKPEQIEHLRHYCCDVHTVPMHRSRLQDIWHWGHSLMMRRPFLIARDNVAAMRHTLRDLVTRQSFEAIHADQLWMAQYALAAKRYHGHPSSLQTTLDQHNAVYLIPKRLTTGTTNPLKRAILTLESRHMARYEVETCRQFDHVVWVTAEDQAAVARQHSSLAGERDGVREHVIPICIDPEAKAVISRQPQARRVTFLGGLHWPPNAEGIVWFTNEVWPHVRQQVPDAVLTVIGKNPPRQLGGRLGDGLEATGYVDDPTPYLAETAAFIVPLHAGGGMRVKILDAWSWGLPVVSTAIGAEGIHYRDGDNLLIADKAGAFAQAVIRLLCEPALADRLAAAGRRTVETEYDWRQIYQKWDLVYGQTRVAPTLT